MDFNADGEEMCRIRRGDRFQKPRDWNAKLVPSIDSQEIETVRWLFNMYATTERSTRSMGIELNRRSVPSPNGKEWDYTQIKKDSHASSLHWMTDLWTARCGTLLPCRRGRETDSGASEGIQHDVYAPIIVKDSGTPFWLVEWSRR